MKLFHAKGNENMMMKRNDSRLRKWILFLRSMSFFKSCLRGVSGSRDERKMFGLPNDPAHSMQVLAMDNRLIARVWKLYY